MSKHEVLTCMKLGCTAYDELAEKNKTQAERIVELEKYHTWIRRMALDKRLERKIS